MSGRFWIAVATLLVGVAFAIIGETQDVSALLLLAGLLVLVAVGVLLSQLGFWKRLGLGLPDVGPLFPRVPKGGRWCDRCGTVTAAAGPCKQCGFAPAPKPLSRKERPKPAGKPGKKRPRPQLRVPRLGGKKRPARPQKSRRPPRP